MRNIRVKEYFKNEATRCGPIAEIANVPQAGKLGNNLLQLERHQRVRGDVISLNYACSPASQVACVVERYYIASHALVALELQKVVTKLPRLRHIRDFRDGTAPRGLILKIFLDTYIPHGLYTQYGISIRGRR